MDALALDPISALLAAGEGKFEWVRGTLLEMPPPSFEHDQTRSFLDRVMGVYVEQKGLGAVVGETYFEHLDNDLVRAPDLAFFRKENLERITPNFSRGGADLIVEVVSPDSRTRDRRDKFYEYAKAGVEEYWIVDPERRQAEFYRLYEGAYEGVQPDMEGKVHPSVLSGFFIRVEWLWNRPDPFVAYRELGLL